MLVCPPMDSFILGGKTKYIASLGYCLFSVLYFISTVFTTAAHFVGK